MSRCSRRLAVSTLGLALLLALCSPSVALDLEANTVFARIVDGGQGLCSVTVLPEGQIIVYDTGHWNHDDVCLEGVREVVSKVEALHRTGPIRALEMMILSHSDSDHLAATDEILSAFDVETVIWSPFFLFYENKTKPGTFVDARDAIGRAVNEGRIRREINLADEQLVFGQAFTFGDASVTPVYGQNRPPIYWNPLSTSKRRNAGSTTIRIDFAGRSILLTGDVVGRKDGGPLSSCRTSEKYMVDNADKSGRGVLSAVLIAPHHGADNASADCFIKEVDPEFVIFSAGQGYEHPRSTAALRYHQENNIPLDRIFRTDLGDDEGSPEWAEGRIPGNGDPVGDDDVDILIRASGEVCVGYRNRPLTEVCVN